jgi:hypothetical protein
VAAKKSPTAATKRPYTGYNGTAGGTTAGLNVLIRTLERETRRGLFNNGAWGIRDMKGKPGQPSVHATGRAVDMSWRNVEGPKGDGPNAAWRGQPYRSACNIIELLVANADAIGLEMIIDYFPHPWGRAWRCDRGRWRKYDNRTVSGAPGGDWFHIEISPAMGANPEAMKQALLLVFPRNPPQP